MERFYDVTLAGDDADFEPFANRSAISAQHSDLLSIALKYKLYSYVEERLRSVNKIETSGRPYLNYLIPTWNNDASSEKKLGLLRMLLSKSCDPNCVFNLGSTWEFVLLCYNITGLWTEHRTKVLLLFLEFGANPNQQIIILNYECFPLHLILSEHARPDSITETITLEFLKKGADVNAKDSKGYSVIQLAQKNCP